MAMPSTARPSSRRSAAERNAEIAETARRIALTDGLPAITLRSVAAGMGVAPALVAHYQPSMDVVVADAFTAVTAAELRELDELAHTHADPVAQLSALLTTLLDGSRAAVSLVWVQSWSLGERNEVLARRARELMDEWRAFLAVIISAGTERGAFRADDPAGVAGQILGMIDGVNAHSVVGWTGSDRIDLMERSVEALLDAPRGTLARARARL
jgi:AcrR family transcriptional regulator